MRNLVAFALFATLETIAGQVFMPASKSALESAVDACLTMASNGDCTGYQHYPMGDWDTSKITDMSGLFAYESSFNAPIGNWNTESVTSMYSMFRGASAFNQPLNFDTPAVANMKFMFRDTSAFNQPLSFTDTSSVPDMESMFRGSSFNQPLNFATSSVTTMHSMFRDASAFNQPLNFDDTTSVTITESMFRGASAFNQPLDFETPAVTTMHSMFRDASSFNQPLDFDTTSVTTMDSMLYGAIAFDQYWQGWDISASASKSNFCNACPGTCTLADLQTTCFKPATTTEAAADDLAWLIESGTPAVEAEFSAGDDPEIIFKFRKTPNRDHRFNLYQTGGDTPGEFFCNVQSPVTVGTEPASRDLAVNDGLQEFAVDVDIDITTIAGSSVYFPSEDGNSATIEFCGRVDLYINDVDVSFIEVPIQVTVDLTQGFDVTAVLNRAGAATVTENAVVDYSLEACQCDPTMIGENTRCSGEDTTGVSANTLQQNSKLELCISSTSDDVEIVKIQSLRIEQVGGTGEYIYAIGTGTLTEASNDETVSALTAYAAAPAHIQSVQTRLVSKFFPAVDEIPSIKVVGQALVQFDSGDRRLAEISIGRSLATTNSESGFELTVQLENEEQSQEVSAASSVWSAVFGVVVVAMTLA